MATGNQNSPDVIIIGGGLSGLCCALHLQKNGVSFQILEAAEEAGGRVATDEINGFLLDRGFQVFLTAYPEARQVLDYEALDLKPLYPGALIWSGGKMHRFADPWRKPWDAVKSLFAPIGTWSDKLRIAHLRHDVRRGSIEDLFDRPEMTTAQFLEQRNFSENIISRFFKPFFGGIFLERDLVTSSRMFTFVFRMFSGGQVTLPSAGMQAIPRQIVAHLPENSLRTNAEVTSIDDGTVTLQNGEILSAQAIVSAVEAPVAARLLKMDHLFGSRGVSCFYFAADKPPLNEPILVLNGEEKGPVNNVAVLREVSATYAPPGAALISASVIDHSFSDQENLLQEVQEQMTSWFGPQVRTWEHLRTYHIQHALPEQEPPALLDPQRPVKLGPRLFICGDHRENASIDGAMVSGRRAAEAVLHELT